MPGSRHHPTPDDIANSLLLQTIQQRGVEAVIDLGDQGAAISNGAFGEAQAVVDALPAELTDQVAGGQLAYAWTTVGGQPSLVVGGAAHPSGPDVYFIHDATGPGAGAPATASRPRRRGDAR